MGNVPDPFSRFKPAGPNNKPFFETVSEAEADAALRQRLEDVLGPQPDAVYAALKPIAQQSLEQAIVQFLDSPIEFQAADESSTDPQGQHRAGVASASASPQSSSSASPKSRTETASPELSKYFKEGEADDSAGARESGNPAEPESGGSEQEDQWIDDARYIGSIQADAWCTRSGRALVNFGETLRVDRVCAAPTGSTKQREDIIVRFYNSDGLDFARAREEDARFMSVLLDANVCRFEATVIFADSYLRLGSTVYVQVDCYLKRAAFSEMSMFSVDLKRGVVDETKETQEERLVRLRQVALNNLFSRVGIISDSGQDFSQALRDVNKSAGIEVDDEEQDMSQDQLDLFYKSAVSAPRNVEHEEVDPAPSFGLELFPYQKRGLGWMLQRERTFGNGSKEALAKEEARLETHPLWTELNWPKGGDPFWANLNSGELSLVRPTLESRSRGGILADEMGLGKTISTLALVHSGVNETSSHATLVVAPMSLLSQWEAETQKAAATPQSCGCLVYYGSASGQARQALTEFVRSAAYQHKVVITSYGMVTSEHKQSSLTRNSSGGLFDTIFDRIILDEAHTIKNRATQTSKACFDLKGHRRWVLTGTPVVNRLEDLYSLVRFIGIEPWNNFTFWRAFITEQFAKPETRERAMKTVQAVVAPICLRRTKAMKDPATGRSLVELPSKMIEVKRIPFTQDEHTLYSHLYAQVRESVQDQVMQGVASSKYTAILALLLRLRQVCCHPLLLKKQIAATDDDTLPGVPPPSKKIKTEAHGLQLGLDDDLKLDLTADIESLLEKFSSAPSIEYTAETLKRLLEHPLEEEECAICSDNQDEPVLTECLHSACRDCMTSHIDYLKRRGEQALCHICRSPIDSRKLFIVNREAKRLQPLNGAMESSKVRALVSALRQASAQNVGKAVVFSQFTSFLDLIEVNLREAGFPVFRFDGSMTQLQRTAAVDGFKSDPHSNAVFLLSLKAGGVGLNLVVAKQAYIMDPWWSFAVESQAIDRIHRMGQTDPVKVTRFIIEGSIEERMLKIQERKRALSNLVTEEERRAEQLENIKLLLQLPETSASGYVYK